MNTDVIGISSTSRPLAWAVASGVALLAGGAFALSFSALRDLALRAGVDAGLAFIWPLIVDGFIVIATAAAFALKHRGRRVSWYPWSAVVLFSTVSVAGNALHALDNPTGRLPVIVAALVSAVPAAALLVASHLLVVMIDGRRRPRASGASRRAAENPHPETKPPAAIRSAATPANALSAPLLEEIRALVANGETITGLAVARICRVSERTGRRRLEEMRQQHPELFHVGEVQ